MKRHDEARKLFRHKKKKNQWWRSGDAWAEQRIPGWKQLREKSVFVAAVTQFAFTMRKMLKDMQLIPEHKQMVFKYEHLLSKPDEFQQLVYDYIVVPHMSKTNSVVNTIYKPTYNAGDILTKEEFRIINIECRDIFDKTNYEMTF
jgi:hypothetical protein